MYILGSCYRPIVTLFVLGLLIISFCAPLISNADLTYSILAQLDDGSNLMSSDMATESEKLIGSLVSPRNLMESVLDEVKNTNTSNKTDGNNNAGSYSQGENIILSHQVIPAKDFIHLFNTYPFAIAEGSISAKLPCDSDNHTPLRVMIGQIPKLYPANLSIERDLSRPGYMCLYNFEIQQNSTSNGNTSAITDIVLLNTGGERTVLPNTSTFIIGVTKLYPVQNVTGPRA